MNLQLGVILAGRRARDRERTARAPDRAFPRSAGSRRTRKTGAAAAAGSCRRAPRARSRPAGPESRMTAIAARPAPVPSAKIVSGAVTERRDLARRRGARKHHAPEQPLAIDVAKGQGRRIGAHGRLLARRAARPWAAARIRRSPDPLRAIRRFIQTEQRDRTAARARKPRAVSSSRRVVCSSSRDAGDHEPNSASPAGR